MSFLENMEKRYATKKYDADFKIDPTIIEELKKIVGLSPSSINSQPWKFSFVQSHEVKKRLGDASLFNKHKVEDSALVVVFSVIDDVAVFETQIKNNLPQGAVDYFDKIVKPLGDDFIKNWMARQVYISVGVLLSAAANMGLDATPMEGLEPEKYAKILDLDKYQPLVVVAIGKRSEEDSNQPSITPKSRLKFEEVVKMH